MFKDFLVLLLITTTMSTTTTIKIFGFIGNAGHGKNAAADAINNHYSAKNNYKVYTIAFADSLKDVCKEFFNLTHDQCHGNLKDVVDSRYGIAPRKMFQFIGTDIVRNQFGLLFNNEEIAKTFWINKLNEKIKKIIHENKDEDEDKDKNEDREENETKKILILVTDVRFENEATFIKSLPYFKKIIHIIRPNSSFRDNDVSDVHESEKLNEISADLILHNDVENLDYFHKKVLYTLASLL